MIFAAVGTQLPFDRFVEALDKWDKAFDDEIIAQIGVGGKYKPTKIKYYEILTATEFDQLCSEADILVAHAGMGVILSARKYRKPLIIMPRKAELNEHRNNHQVATAKHFGEMDGIYVANNISELYRLLDNRNKLLGSSDIKGVSKALEDRICSFIDEEN